MELQEIIDGLNNFDELKKTIEKTKPEAAVKPEDAAKQWDPKTHAITDKATRPDKLVETDGGTSVVTVSRIPVPLQKKIVSRAAQFLCGNPIELRAKAIDQNQTDLLTVLHKIWDDNKLDYESKRLVKLMMRGCEVAELWYVEDLKEDPSYWAGTPNEAAKFRLRMKVLAPSLGDNLYPVFNSFGDMIAFGRGYTVAVAGKKEEHFDLYTAESIYQGVKGDGGWAANDVPNQIKKIPVVYYSQEAPEWNDVQEMIERLELLISRHADTNDYFGDPMVVVEGEIEGFAKKGESGKLLQMKNGGKAQYLSWDSAPESVKMEYTNLRSLIFEMTDTPDITFDSVKGLGTFSGIALKMIFMGAHMKAAEKEEDFGKGIQRRINFLKAAVAVMNTAFEPAQILSVKPRFEYYLPKNLQELIEMLSTATGGKPIMSTETAVRNNPLVEDAESELVAMEKDGLNSAME
jgi:SPP1 family phage portal protein